jgi:hypothetical protein
LCLATFGVLEVHRGCSGCNRAFKQQAGPQLFLQPYNKEGCKLSCRSLLWRSALCLCATSSRLPP